MMETEVRQSSVQVADQENLEKIIIKIKEDGPQKLHVLADFDRTLTYSVVDGKPVPSMISVLYSANYLPPECNKEAEQLFEHYHAIELDPTVSKPEKKKAMDEWWRKVFALIINYALTKDMVEQVVRSGKLKFRAGVLEFVQMLHEAQIPIVIMSSSGLGGNAIEMYLEHEKHLYDNIHIIGNEFIWDENGKAIGVQEPIIHVMNKDETAIQNFPVFEKIQERKNVLLIGDSPGDIGMVEGFDYNNLIKIGFLNQHEDKHLDDFKKIYDLVLLGDGTFEYINNLTKNLLNKS